MAIATDIEVNWVNTIDSTNKIGLSKPLNQLGVDVFDDADYCLGYQNKALKLTKESESYPHSTDAGADNVPFYLLNNVGYTKNTANEPDGVYYRTILIAVPNEFTWGWDSNLRSNNSQVRIVTKLDLQKNKLYFTTTETQKNALTTSDVYLVNESIENTTATGNFVIGADTYHIRCADIYLTENGYYIKFQTYIDNMYDNFNPTYGEGVAANFNYDANSSKMYSVSPVWFANVAWVLAISGSGNPNTYYIQTWNNTELDIAPDADNADIKFFAGYRLVSPYYWRVDLNYSVEYALWIAASYGLLFEWNGVAYKPVIEYGALKGYTNDMTVPSDIDNWTDISGHNISPTPPTPPAPEEDPRDASIYGTYSGGAGVFARCWYCNQDALNSLWLWAGGSDDPDDPQPPEGFSPINSIIGLQLFPVNIPLPRGAAKTAIVFFNAIAEGDRTVNTHVSDDVYLGDGKTFDIDLGSVTVVEHHANDWAYLDYDETVELYIPFCGVYSIDTQTVMGKTITAKLYVDPIAGTCTFIATCDNVDVAMGSGSMAVSLPVTANQYSMTLAAINTNRAAARNAAISSATVGAAQVGASFASGYSSGYKGAENQMLSVAGSYDDLADIYGAGNPVKIARGAGLRSGLSNAFTSLSNGFTSASIGGLINSALNTRRANKILASSNNTAVSGSFGGSQDTWRLPMQAYIKTIRYMTKIPNNHVDVIGKIFLQETTLANCSGYTTVANPNLSSLTGFLTTAELTELYGILLNGIYAGGGAE